MGIQGIGESPRMPSDRLSRSCLFKAVHGNAVLDCDNRPATFWASTKRALRSVVLSTLHPAGLIPSLIGGWLFSGRAFTFLDRCCL